MKPFNAIDKANEICAVDKVLSDVAKVEIPEHVEGRTGKLYCPFGEFYHSDNGQEPTVRLYTESNSAFCFRCNQTFYPVSLASAVLGVSKTKAAWFLLELVGFKLPSFEELWDKYTNPAEVPPDTSMLALALSVYCRRISDSWATQQFDKDIAKRYSVCLEALDSVATERHAEQWLVSCKEFMAKVLT